MELDKLANNVNIIACVDTCKYDKCQENHCEIYRALKAAQKDERIERLEQGYQAILDTISPYLSDFDGINEKGEFDIVLAIKELLENSRIKQKTKIESTKRYKPELGERYFYLSDTGDITYIIWNNDGIDNYRYSIGNCFKIEQEAKDFKENCLTKQALKDLATKLNKEVEIDWESFQCKYFIFTSSIVNGLHTTSAVNLQSIGQVYCLNSEFLSIAKKRIGEEKLIKLIKSGV